MKNKLQDAQGEWTKWKFNEGQEKQLREWKWVKEKRKKAQEVVEMKDRQRKTNIHIIWILKKKNKTMERS